MILLRGAKIVYSDRTNKKIYFIVMIAVLLFLSTLSFLAVKKMSYPSLVGKWRSLETGQQVIFTENGEVKLEKPSDAGKYTILSSSKMQYTINRKSFIMYFEIKDKNLLWGTDKNHLEVFIKSYF